MEKFLRDHNSFLAPYAVNYSTREEFFEMYNEKVYEEARVSTKSEGVWVDLYKKIGGGKKIEKIHTQENKHEQNGIHHTRDPSPSPLPSPSPSPRDDSPPSSTPRSFVLHGPPSHKGNGHSHSHAHSDKGPHRRTKRAD
jgi:hypothetical protein